MFPYKFLHLKRALKIICVTFGCGAYVGSHYVSVSYIDGVSMQPTLNPVLSGRHYVTNFVFLRRIHDLSTIQRGDIVTFVPPNSPDEIVIKRVIALEGDVVSQRSNFERVRISRGHCWVEGDNKKRSIDSNKYGEVPLGLLQHKAIHIIWPLSSWGPLKSKQDPNRLKDSILSNKEAKDNGVKTAEYIKTNGHNNNTIANIEMDCVQTIINEVDCETA